MTIFQISSAILVACGAMLLLCPIKRRNLIFGYRTANSMHGKESWRKANRAFAKSLILIGALSEVVAWLILLVRPDLFSHGSELILTLFVGQALLLFVAIVYIDRSLVHGTRTEDEHGNEG